MTQLEMRLLANWVKKHPQAWVMAFVLAALALRLCGLDKSIWIDEAFTIHDAFASNFFHSMTTSDHPFLYSWFLRGWSVLGKDEITLRLPSVILGSATVLVLMETLLPVQPKAALLTGLLAVVSPPLLRFSQEIRDYALLLFLTSLAFWFANQMIHKTHHRLAKIGLSLTLTAAVLTHLVGVFLLPALFVYLLAHPAGRNPKNLIIFLLPAAVFGMYFFAFLSPVVRAHSQDGWGFQGLTLPVLLFVLAYMLGLFAVLAPLPALETSSAVVTINPLSVIVLVSLLLITAALATGRWRQSYAYLLAAAAYLGGMAVYSLGSTVIINERTVLPGLIPLLIFAGLQLAGDLQPVRRTITTVALGWVCLSAALNWTTYQAWTPLEDWKNFLQVVSVQYQPGDKIILFPGYSQAVLDYYMPHNLSQDILPLDILSDRGQPFDAVREDFQSRLSGAKKVYLIYRYDLSAARDPFTLPGVQAILNSRFGPPQHIQSGKLELWVFAQADLMETK